MKLDIDGKSILLSDYSKLDKRRNVPYMDELLKKKPAIFFIGKDSRLKTGSCVDLDYELAIELFEQSVRNGKRVVLDLSYLILQDPSEKGFRRIQEFVRDKLEHTPQESTIIYLIDSDVDPKYIAYSQSWFSNAIKLSQSGSSTIRGFK